MTRTERQQLARLKKILTKEQLVELTRCTLKLLYREGCIGLDDWNWGRKRKDGIPF